MPVRLEIYNSTNSEWEPQSFIPAGEGYQTIVSYSEERPIVYIVGSNKADQFGIVRKVYPTGAILPDAEYVEFPQPRSEKIRLDRQSVDHTRVYRLKPPSGTDRKLIRFKFI